MCVPWTSLSQDSLSRDRPTAETIPGILIAESSGTCSSPAAMRVLDEIAGRSPPRWRKLGLSLFRDACIFTHANKYHNGEICRPVFPEYSAISPNMNISREYINKMNWTFENISIIRRKLQFASRTSALSIRNSLLEDRPVRILSSSGHLAKTYLRTPSRVGERLGLGFSGMHLTSISHDQGEIHLGIPRMTDKRRGRINFPT